VTTYTENRLIIEVKKDHNILLVNWQGKSDARNPGEFISPILHRCCTIARESSLSIHMNFVNMDMMNSSSISPLIKMLTEAKKSGQYVVLQYDEDSRWQRLNFNALKALQTPGKEISICGISSH